MIYDLKMLRPDKNTRLKSLYEKYIGRMDEGQRAAWDKFYTPVIDDFYRQNLQGKELANWKFQRYMRDYMKTVKSLDDNVGRVLDYLKEKGLLDNTLVVYTSDQGFYMANTVGLINASCTKNPCVHRLSCVCRKDSTAEVISQKWYRTSTMHPPSSNWQGRNPF